MGSIFEPKKEYMQLAIAEAKKAQEEGDYAIGAVLVREDEVIAVANNRSFRDESPIAHAETLAILKASEKLGRRHMPELVLYTTHEPCTMCASVAVWAKLRGVVYGARYQDMLEYRNSNQNGEHHWRTMTISCEEVFTKSPEEVFLVRDFMREECRELFH